MITKNHTKLGGWNISYENKSGGVTYVWTAGTRKDAERELQQLIKEDN